MCGAEYERRKEFRDRRAEDLAVCQVASDLVLRSEKWYRARSRVHRDTYPLYLAIDSESGPRPEHRPSCLLLHFLSYRQHCICQRGTGEQEARILAVVSARCHYDLCMVGP